MKLKKVNSDIFPALKTQEKFWQRKGEGLYAYFWQWDGTHANSKWKRRAEVTDYNPEF